MSWRRPKCVVCGERVRRSEWRAKVLIAAERDPLLDALTLRGAVWGLLGELPQQDGVAHSRCVSTSDAMIQKFFEDAGAE